MQKRAHSCPFLHVSSGTIFARPAQMCVRRLRRIRLTASYWTSSRSYRDRRRQCFFRMLTAHPPRRLFLRLQYAGASLAGKDNSDASSTMSGSRTRREIRRRREERGRRGSCAPRPNKISSTPTSPTSQLLPDQCVTDFPSRMHPAATVIARETMLIGRFRAAM
jgi:hypothetical protein